jgi:hypothetical protein
MIGIFTKMQKVIKYNKLMRAIMKEWHATGQKKIVLKIDTEKEMYVYLMLSLIGLSFIKEPKKKNCQPTKLLML